MELNLTGKANNDIQAEIDKGFEAIRTKDYLCLYEGLPVFADVPDF